ncbi:putative ABC transporter permease [Denitrobacterium detoxificans]|uniref:Putative ABC-transporter type IV n=1 Tax=Denitrobacterium detoxificans TaxID=79604 RepID=A0A1H8QEX0_9ACTN|nr:putative ABC transporter permease [Denitrobacterium detoxificans]SEO52785.1 Putative ABC-transporter type IV [Denitrobacterium detoxificans]
MAEGAENSASKEVDSGRADRARITRGAQLDAAEAVAMAGVAMESDAEADEARRESFKAERAGDRAAAKEARARERAARKRANADHAAATKSARQAYQAIKFSAPNKMGFMRVVQVLFAVHIFFTLVGLIMSSRDTVVYSSSNVLDWFMIVFEGVAFWLFVNRYKIARPFVIAMAVVAIVVPGIASAVAGDFSLLSTIFGSIYYVFLIFYFIFSKRVKAVLVNDVSFYRDKADKEEFVINRRGWPFVRNLIMYFIVFSVLGHWMEAGMCQFIRLGIVQGEYDPTNTMLWRDWLYPYPMEGAAVVIIALALYPLLQWLKKKFNNRIIPYVISFVANALVCSLIEFSMGLIVNADLQLWNYSDNFGNIMGQVCLQNALAFGVAASIIAWFVYPLLERWIARVPRDIMNIAFVVILVFGGILWSLYLIDPPQNHANDGAFDTPREQTASDRESESYLFSLTMGSSTLEEMKEDIENSQTLTPEQKETALRHLDEALSNLKDVEADIGVEQLEAAS